MILGARKNMDKAPRRFPSIEALPRLAPDRGAAGSAGESNGSRSTRKGNVPLRTVSGTLGPQRPRAADQDRTDHRASQVRPPEEPPSPPRANRGYGQRDLGLPLAGTRRKLPPGQGIGKKRSWKDHPPAGMTGSSNGNPLFPRIVLPLSKNATGKHLAHPAFQDELINDAAFLGLGRFSSSASFLPLALPQPEGLSPSSPHEPLYSLFLAAISVSSRRGTSRAREETGACLFPRQQGMAMLFPLHRTNELSYRIHDFSIYLVGLRRDWHIGLPKQ